MGITVSEYYSWKKVEKHLRDNKLGRYAFEILVDEQIKEYHLKPRDYLGLLNETEEKQ